LEQNCTVVSENVEEKHLAVYSQGPSLSYCEIDDPSVNVRTGGVPLPSPLAGTWSNTGLSGSRRKFLAQLCASVFHPRNRETIFNSYARNCKLNKYKL
jgi:hypothetical protein